MYKYEGSNNESTAYFNGAVVSGDYASTISYGGEQNLHDEVGTHSPVQLTGTNSAAEKFNSTQSFNKVSVNCPSWSNSIGNLTLSLYKWNTDYNTTIASTPIASKQFVNYIDNQWLEITFSTQSTGDYLWVLNNPTESVGVYKFEGSTNSNTAYMNGSAVSGDFASKISYKTSEYFYIRNAQGDIIGLVDENGTQVVSYTYDTWGKLISIDGSLKDSVGVKNPYRYRGYRYDTETGLYYLQSRYYNPDWGRFINADAEVGKVGTLISHNMFAYCLNNPVNMSDPLGHMPTWAKWAIGAAVVVAIIAVVVLAPEVVVVAAELASDVGAELAAGVVAVGTEIEEASPRIEEATSKLKEVASKAENYILKESQYNDHIIARHGATSTQYLSKSKFASNFDVKKGIDVALKSAKSLIRPNTNGRSGYIVEHTFDNIIGYNNKGRGVYTMKAVIDEVGKIVTVFPK